MARTKHSAEHRRLDEARDGKKWRRWGTYLSERQWGTVREDYSADGDAWGYITHEQARSRAYRWGEDGLLGLCDNRGLINFSLALWNGKDPFLKERLFGLTGPEGNHGEDVKELYWYCAATPTCSYAHGLYKYPQREFPYAGLRAAAAAASRTDPEPELAGSGIFDEDRYFDVDIQYAKGDIEDLVMVVTVTNRGPEAAELTLLPQVFFRNTWSWGLPRVEKPKLVKDGAGVRLEDGHLGKRWFYAEDADSWLFTENETNLEALYKIKNTQPYVKDAFHRHVVDGDAAAVNPAGEGTKVAALYRVTLQSREERVFRFRLCDEKKSKPFADAEAILGARVGEHHEFYDACMPAKLNDGEREVYQQSLAGLLWTKQFYFFDIDRWLRGDPAYPPPPKERKRGRNYEWTHLYNSEVLSMPDKWEYPWYAAWDLAFHTIPMALIDPDYAKQQLSLLLREWYMHPNGQLPAYEWSFGDVNPPVHAWAALRVYQIERRETGHADRAFLEGVFHKLLLNFTWWVNRKDAAGNNVFQGGFLGLDNIGVFDRSNAPLPAGGTLEQADGTSWMAMYCLNLLAIALELARENPSYQDVANKFFEHFLLIAHAMKSVDDGADGVGGINLWDETDGFFYDVLHMSDGESEPMRVRSMVGLIPLFAVETFEPSVEERFPEFMKRVRWFVENRPELTDRVVPLDQRGEETGRGLLAILDKKLLVRVLERLLDEKEFLSPYGVRSLSRAHAEHPYVMQLGGTTYRIDYEPGESHSGLFGGNSNWRGPVWFPVNYLIIESLQKFHHFYGDDLKVECPTGSGNFMNLWDVASEISHRLTQLFVPDEKGVRPADRGNTRANDPHFHKHLHFYEYFHGDDGRGLGASHQTGWTALVAKLLQQSPKWDREQR